jgi:hypothetical protein
VKFRGISATLVATVVVAFAAANANAAKLVYTQAQSSTGIAGTTNNPLVPAGSVLYTIAVQVTADDGVGALGASLTFTGVPATSPIQLASKSGGVANVQSFQDAIDNGAATVNATQNADSWFYSVLSTNDGQVLDADGNAAVSNPALLYPGLAANPFALGWSTSNSPNAINNTTGATMSLTGLWGNPTSANPDILAASQVGPGNYPIAQLLVPASSTVPIASGDSLGIATPNGKFYNVLGTIGGAGGAGAFISGDPLAYKSSALAIGPAVPEPSTIVLAGLGIAGVFFARRRRK